MSAPPAVGPVRAETEPASVVAARQLADEARQLRGRRTPPRRRGAAPAPPPTHRTAR